MVILCYRWRSDDKDAMIGLKMCIRNIYARLEVTHSLQDEKATKAWPTLYTCRETLRRF